MEEGAREKGGRAERSAAANYTQQRVSRLTYARVSNVPVAYLEKMCRGVGYLL